VLHSYAAKAAALSARVLAGGAAASRHTRELCERHLQMLTHVVELLGRAAEAQPGEDEAGPVLRQLRRELDAALMDSCVVAHVSRLVLALAPNLPPDAGARLLDLGSLLVVVCQEHGDDGSSWTLGRHSRPLLEVVAVQLLCRAEGEREGGPDWHGLPRALQWAQVPVPRGVLALNTWLDALEPGCEVGGRGLAGNRSACSASEASSVLCAAAERAGAAGVSRRWPGCRRAAGGRRWCTRCCAPRGLRTR
jgi:hypothetical protein